LKNGEKLKKGGAGSGGREMLPWRRGWVGGRCKFTGENGAKITPQPRRYS
jgi:hypothetical protein